MTNVYALHHNPHVWKDPEVRIHLVQFLMKHFSGAINRSQRLAMYNVLIYASLNGRAGSQKDWIPKGLDCKGGPI